MIEAVMPMETKDINTNIPVAIIPQLKRLLIDICTQQFNIWADSGYVSRNAFYNSDDGNSLDFTTDTYSSNSYNHRKDKDGVSIEFWNTDSADYELWITITLYNREFSVDVTIDEIEDSRNSTTVDAQRRIICMQRTLKDVIYSKLIEFFRRSYKIYIVSSWRNMDKLDKAKKLITDAGHTVLDFRENNCHLSEIDPNYKGWDATKFVKELNNPLIQQFMLRDKRMLEAADMVVLLLPCGKSAHLELGYAAGINKDCYVIVDDSHNNEFTYLLCTDSLHVVKSIEEFVEMLNSRA